MTQLPGNSNVEGEGKLPHSHSMRRLGGSVGALVLPIKFMGGKTHPRKEHKYQQQKYYDAETNSQFFQGRKVQGCKSRDVIFRNATTSLSKSVSIIKHTVPVPVCALQKIEAGT
jgi:hypothetical protein